MKMAANPLPDDPRAALDALARARGEDYAALSRLVGRNAAYIQQYIKRGSPKRLGERERGILARYFGVAESVLGAVAAPGAAPFAASASDRLTLVPRLDIGASAGPGGLYEDDRTIAHFAFDPRWLKSLGAEVQRLAIIRVEGDSMLPTLADGDDIMVDSGDGAPRLRDGIYVLRRDGVLLVKRLARGLAGAAGTVAIISDNRDAYPAETGVPVAELDIVGRVVWTGRRVG